MANKLLKSIKFPDLTDTYIVGDTSLSVAGAGADAKATGDALATKAEVDGYYSNLTAGSAEQLLSTVTIEDEVPYQFRTSGGSADIGDRETDMLVGGTVAWNQYIKSDFSSGVDGWQGENGSYLSFSASNGILTATYNGGATAAYQLGVRPSPAVVPFVKDHKVLITVDINVSRSGGYALRNLDAFGSSNVTILTNNDAADTWHRKTKIVNVLNNSNYYAYFLIVGPASNYSNGDTFKFKNHMIIDLTQLFGSTIADYIYSLETANAGAGVAWFRKLFPKSYYAYDAGTLKSVGGVSSHDMVGFNAFDKDNADIAQGSFDTRSPLNTTNVTTYNYIPVIGGATYNFHSFYPTGGGRYYRLYDANKNQIGDQVAIYNVYLDNIIAIPTNARYIRIMWFTSNGVSVADIMNGNICLNLSWDGERDGEYEPYVKHSYALDDSLTLRGVPKLDSSNNLYYDGDTYESDGTVTRKYGIVDLGTLDWSKSSSGNNYYVTLSTTLPHYAFGAQVGMVCAKYAFAGTRSTSPYYDSTDKTLTCFQRGTASNPSEIYIHDEVYTSASDFKTAMNGVYLVYEFATPTTETADPYTNPQIVDDFGTEEYVTTSIVPVGHKTQYMPNLRAKLEMAPNSPNGNGDYIVRQTNGMNEYVPLVIEDTLPTIPSTAGSYKLTVTVTEGSDPVLSWEAE